jgi:DNA-directed RNA polymerase subunit RPC12/RpoP
MWRCIRCGAEFDANQAEPNVDDFGLHFMCPECGRRNRLISYGEQDGMLVLEQPREEE